MREPNELLKLNNENMYSALVMKNVEKVNEVVSERIEAIRQYALEQRNKELEEAIRQSAFWTQAYRSCMDTKEENIAYCMGLLNGVTAAARQRRREEKEAEEYAVSHPDTKYYKLIFQELSKVDYIQHKDLAEKLSIKPNQLTNIMKKIAGDGQHMIISTNTGKFKYYFLSETGKKYYRSRLVGEEQKEIEELLERLIERVESKNRMALFQYACKNYPCQKEVRKKIFKLDQILELEGNASPGYGFDIRFLDEGKGMHSRQMLNTWQNRDNTMPNLYMGSFAYAAVLESESISNNVG